MLKLQEDSNLLAEFNRDPDKVMIEVGITSEEDRNVLKTRDMLKIRQLLEKKKYTNNRKEEEAEDKIRSIFYPSNEKVF